MKESKIVLKLTYHIIFITQNFHIPKSKKRYIHINIQYFVLINYVKIINGNIHRKDF